MTRLLLSEIDGSAHSWERYRWQVWSGGRRWLERAIGAGLCGFARWFTATRVYGAEGLRERSRGRQRVYVANHTSHADFLLLWASLPAELRTQTRPVAAADYWEQGAVRRYLSQRVFRAVPLLRTEVDRRHNPLAAMLAALDAGDSLILFPEGTRGDGSELGGFRCGVYHLLRERPDVEVIPVWLEGVHRVFPRGAVLPAPLPCSVAFGDRVVFDHGLEKSAFLCELRTRMNELRLRCRQQMAISSC